MAYDWAASPRIIGELRRQGHRRNHKRVERLLRQAQLKGRTGRRKKVRTPDSDPTWKGVTH